MRRPGRCRHHEGYGGCGERVILVCQVCAQAFREVMDEAGEEWVATFLTSMGLTVSLDEGFILRASLPRRYGGGSGAGLQLSLEICEWCGWGRSPDEIIVRGRAEGPSDREV